MDSLKLAQKIADLASEVKAIDIKILDLRKFSSFTDFFVVCSGTSDRQIRAIADKVILDLKKENVRPMSSEGFEQGDWILVDYADVVLHVFGEEARKHYDLEGFWNRVPSLSGEKKPKKKSVKKKPVKSKSKGKSKAARGKKPVKLKASSSKKKKK